MRVQLAAAVAAAGAALVVVGPAYASPAQPSPGCVSRVEYNHYWNRPTRSGLEAYFETTGVAVQRDVLYQVRAYPLCGHPDGWVQVDYRPAKPGGWVVDGPIFVVASCTDVVTDAVDGVPTATTGCVPGDLTLEMERAS